MKRASAVLLSLCVAAGGWAFAGEDYGKQVDALLPRLGSDNVGEANGAQQALFKLCADTSVPGADAERAAACEAIASRLANAKPAARMWMLRGLERIGRGESVQPVAVLLAEPDELVRDAARRALQNNPAPEADQALLKALEAADKPAWRASLLNAIGWHGAADPAIARVLLKDLASGDESVSLAAALAVARTGDKGVIEALADVMDKGSPLAQATAATACLQLGNRLCAKDDQAGALAAYRKLFAGKGQVKCAGLIGLARAGGAAELNTILEAMGDADPRLRGAAVEAVAFVPSKEAIPALAAKLKDAAKDLKIAILRGLAALDDKSAAPPLVEALADTDEEVKVTALRGLGSVGDGSAVLPLAKAAAAGGNPGNVARESLDRLTAGDVVDALLACLKDADAKVRSEAARSLGVRRSEAAVPGLLKMAEDADPAVRNEAFKALAGVAGPDQLPTLAGLVAKTNDASDAAVSAVLAAALRTKDVEKRVDPVVAECAKAAGPARLALLTVLGRLGGPKALEVLRAALKDPDEEVKKGAVRALGEWPDTTAGDDLLALAKGAPNEVLQVLALRGYIRLAGLAKDRPAEALKMYQAALENAKRADERRLVLSGLAEVKDVAALNMVEPLMDDAALKEEACAAAVGIGKDIIKKSGDAVRKVLEKVAGVAKRPEVLRDANKLLGVSAAGRLEVHVSEDPNSEKGVNYACYEGDWDRLPDFSKLKPNKTGKCAYFDLSVRTSDDQFGLKFTGFVRITEAGNYAFSTYSDDGSRLYIGDQVVVDNDGCHGGEEQIGKIQLNAGMHPITVVFFEKGGGEELEVRGGKMK
jgi:HEAT repeat protein